MNSNSANLGFEQKMWQAADKLRSNMDAAEGGTYEDVPGFCKSATIEEIRKHNYILTPGRYVGFPEEEEDEEPFDEKMARFTKEFAEQFKRLKELEDEIRKNLEVLRGEV
ncbi:MAG: N-6 DNA methylase [Thermoplasmata archaeon]|nr:N-6 DNA methylase [Thermoplasmata archaeon]